MRSSLVICLALLFVLSLAQKSGRFNLYNSTCTWARGKKCVSAIYQGSSNDTSLVHKFLESALNGTNTLSLSWSYNQFGDLFECDNKGLTTRNASQSIIGVTCTKNRRLEEVLEAQNTEKKGKFNLTNATCSYQYKKTCNSAGQFMMRNNDSLVVAQFIENYFRMNSVKGVSFTFNKTSSTLFLCPKNKVGRNADANQYAITCKRNSRLEQNLQYNDDTDSYDSEDTDNEMLEYNIDDDDDLTDTEDEDDMLKEERQEADGGLKDDGYGKFNVHNATCEWGRRYKCINAEYVGSENNTDLVLEYIEHYFNVTHQSNQSWSYNQYGDLFICDNRGLNNTGGQGIVGIYCASIYRMQEEMQLTQHKIFEKFE